MLLLAGLSSAASAASRAPEAPVVQQVFRPLQVAHHNTPRVGGEACRAPELQWLSHPALGVTAKFPAVAKPVEAELEDRKFVVVRETSRAGEPIEGRCAKLGITQDDGPAPIADPQVAFDHHAKSLLSGLPGFGHRLEASRALTLQGLPARELIIRYQVETKPRAMHVLMVVDGARFYTFTAQWEGDAFLPPDAVRFFETIRFISTDR